MRLLILIIATFFLASCLEDALSGQNNGVMKEPQLTIDDVLFDQGAEMLGAVWLLRSGQDFLSENAQKNLKEFINRRAELRRQMMNICGMAPALRDEDKRTIANIKRNQDLENSEKKAQIKDLLNARMKESSSLIISCRQNKKEELKPFIDHRDVLKKACLITFKPDEEIAGHPTKKARAWQRVKTLTNEERFLLNKKLESDSCVHLLGLDMNLNAVI